MKHTPPRMFSTPSLRNIKKTLSKNFSFKKLKTSPEEIAKVQEFTFSPKILHKLADSIRIGFTKLKLKKPSVTNSILLGILPTFLLIRIIVKAKKKLLKKLRHLTIHVILLQLFPELPHLPLPPPPSSLQTVLPAKHPRKV